MTAKLTFLEFFAGGGLARIGLGNDWRCIFANDISYKKAEVYKANFPPAEELLVSDIANVVPGDIPDSATVAWASFPCQDLSLAGSGKGLQAERSGTFWYFWNLVTALEFDGRGVPIIILENVVGLITANDGSDFERLMMAHTSAGYRAGAIIVDAVHFVPQSRPRLFVIAVKQEIPEHLEMTRLTAKGSLWHPASIHTAFNRLPSVIQTAWVWWSIPTPDVREVYLQDLIEDIPVGVPWHTKAETEHLLSLMAPAHLAKVRLAQRHGKRQVGTLYKRMRVEDGVKKQRAEVRFDNISGCLRTPVGGSSRQVLIIIEGDAIRSRLLSVREAARLMGLPDHYKLPSNYNDGYHVMGDAVAVPVVSWLEKHLIRKLAECSATQHLIAVNTDASI